MREEKDTPSYDRVSHVSSVYRSIDTLLTRAISRIRVRESSTSWKVFVEDKVRGIGDWDLSPSRLPVVVLLCAVSFVGPLGRVEGRFCAGIEQSYFKLFHRRSSPFFRVQRAGSPWESHSTSFPFIPTPFKFPRRQRDDPPRPIARAQISVPSSCSCTSRSPLTSSSMSAPAANYDLIRADIKAILNQPE